MTTFRDIVKRFREHDVWGLLTSIDIKNCDPESIRSEIVITRYVDHLCQLLKMKPYGDTQLAHFGNDERVAGFSMVQFIETSLISGHFCNKTNNAYIDIFSCKIYDPYKATHLTQLYFQGENIKTNICFRE
jgi:S-adenosylmethionine/arginine decarboxylase-like enzyme